MGFIIGNGIHGIQSTDRKENKGTAKKKKYSKSYVAEKLFISQAAYSLIKNSQNDVVADHIIKLSELYGVTTDYILKGERMLVRMSSENGFIPYIKEDVHAGFLDNMEQEDYLENVEWYRIPGFNPSNDQKLFEVGGESMVLTLLPGDVVVCQEQNNLEHILDGTAVLILTDSSLLVKRIRIHNDPDPVTPPQANKKPDSKWESGFKKLDEEASALYYRSFFRSNLCPPVKITLLIYYLGKDSSFLFCCKSISTVEEDMF